MIPVRFRPDRPAIVAAVAVVALTGGAGVAFAATSSSQSAAPQTASTAATPSPSPSPSGCQIKLPGGGLPAWRHVFGPPRAARPAGMGPFGAIHGQFVTPKQGGGYQTIDTQRGTVTAVSTGSITVKSGDGFSKTYQVTSSTNVDAQRDGIGSVKTGQTVSVLATVNGSSATATQIVDFAALPTPPKMPAFTPGSRHVFKAGPCVRWHINR